MGTRAVISREQFCADGAYFPIAGFSGEPDRIESSVQRVMGQTLSAIAQDSVCRKRFCTGEHTAEAFHAARWGMHPDFNYYLGSDGKVRATYMLKGSRRLEFGEDHTLAGLKFNILPRMRRERAQRVDPDQEARSQAKEDLKTRYAATLSAADLTNDDILAHARSHGWTDFQIKNGVPYTTRLEMLEAITNA